MKIDINNPNFNIHVLEGRENYLVSKILNSSAKYNFFVYGAGHDFFNNILEWNFNNPNRKVSFIELTPQSILK